MGKLQTVHAARKHIALKSELKAEFSEYIEAILLYTALYIHTEVRDPVMKNNIFYMGKCIQCIQCALTLHCIARYIQHNAH